MTCCPPWYIGLMYHIFIVLFRPISQFSFYLAFFPLLSLYVSDSSLFLCLFCFYSWVTVVFFFLPLYSFNPTFQSIPHNSHPQFMALLWVKVHNTQDWVRATTRLFSALATLNLCFWHKPRCTCPRRDQGQYIVPRKDQLGWKRMIYFKLKSFGSRRD